VNNPPPRGAVFPAKSHPVSMIAPFALKIAPPSAPAEFE
jgi:hypothetical protein